VLAGHDVCGRDLHASAEELVREGILQKDLVDRARSEVASVSARVRTGAVDGLDRDCAGIDAAALSLGSAPPREQIARIAADIAEFRSAENLDVVLVVNLASTEAARPDQREWQSLDRFDEALEEGRAQPASLLYAYAAFSSGCPYINFTPSLGASVPALREVAILSLSFRLPSASFSATIIAISIQTAVIANAGTAAPGTMPKIRNIPGAAENPMVRINSPA
jgi:myo-inositol-1-phosphate synthase